MTHDPTHTPDVLDATWQTLAEGLPLCIRHLGEAWSPTVRDELGRAMAQLGPALPVDDRLRMVLQGRDDAPARLLLDLATLESALTAEPVSPTAPRGEGVTQFDLVRLLAAPWLDAHRLVLAQPLPWTVSSAGELSFERSLGPDDAIVLHPDWMALFDSKRLNAFHRYGTLHLPLGDVAWEIDRLHTEMMARAEEGVPPVPTDEEARYFEVDGDSMRLKSEWYFHATGSILDEDLALLLHERNDRKDIRIAMGAAGLAFFGDLLPRLRRTARLGDLQAQLQPGQWKLVTQLIEAGALQVVPRTVPQPQPDAYRVRLLAHSAVLIGSPTHQVLVDPMIVVRGKPQFDPFAFLERPVDAVFITHSHWDHFTLDGLLHLPKSTTIMLPRHDHPDSIVNVDMGKVVRELGFTDVVELGPFEAHTVGDIEVTALPYHGEPFGPESPRDWATFHARMGGRSIVGLVDAVRDEFGDMDDVLHEVVRRLGPADVLFAPASGFEYPLSHFSRRPFHASLAREQFTGGPDDVVRWATILRAGTVVPYALFHCDEGDTTNDSLSAGSDPFRHGTIEELATKLPAERMQVLSPGEALGWATGGRIDFVGRQS